jgi:hypothetical protein
MAQSVVLPSEFLMVAIVFYGRRFEASFRSRLTPEVHESGIHCHSVEPGRESGFAPEGREFSEGLDERFLSQIVRIRRIVRHPETNSVNAASMQVKQCRERVRLAVQRALNQYGIGLTRD